MVQSDYNMVKSDLHGWLEPKCSTKLTCMKVELRGGKRMSNWMYDVNMLILQIDCGKWLI